MGTNLNPAKKNNHDIQTTLAAGSWPALLKEVTVKTGSTRGFESFPGDWIAYVAAVSAGLFCAVSLYWASGGTAGLQTVGGFAERMARAGGSRSAMVIWVTVVVKAVGVILPLSLVRPWGRIVSRRWRAAACGAASVILVLYGGIQVISEALVELGVIRPAGAVDWVALRWHLELWDSWFLLWGLLLGTATWCFHCSIRVRPTSQSLPPRPTETPDVVGADLLYGHVPPRPSEWEVPDGQSFA